jgi:anthranilate synthase component I
LYIAKFRTMSGEKEYSMDEFTDMLNEAKPGEIIPVVREMEIGDPVDFFARLSDYGRSRNCALLEAKDYLAENALSFGTARPALYLAGKGRCFTIKALTSTGKRMLKYLGTVAKERFAFCQDISFGEDAITGTIPAGEAVRLDEESRLRSVNQMDVLRAVAFAFKLASKPFRVTCGLIGALSYDFIDQFEKLPASEMDLMANQDYELYFADNIFLVDHEHGKGYVVVNVMITNGNRDELVKEVQDQFAYYQRLTKSPVPQSNPITQRTAESQTDTDQGAYEAMVRKAKQHIVDGDIFQVVLSRTVVEPCKDEPFDIYKRLRAMNPSPYMFYINTPETTLIGSSPELNLQVSGKEKRKVTIRPIAGTKPRGRIDGKLDPDTDFRYEAELKQDRKELAEHMMLVDLARNDIARVAEAGTRVVTELLTVEKYASVQHLVSNVKGELRKDLDALSAYLATMNMGTLTGAPKIEAMKVIRKLERTTRGYYGGAVMYLTVDGQFDSCITIRSLQVKDGLAYIRTGAGIVHDSVPATEFEETQHKANSCLRAVRGE